MERFGPYEVFECLGKGGMATVHRAKKRGIEGFERIDALKRLLPHLEADEAFVRSFVNEAKLAAQLRHSNIVQIHDLGCVDGRYYIAMEYLDGRTVQEILRRARKAAGPLPLDVFASIFGELCDALEHAHTRADLAHPGCTGFVHGDVSPSNMVVSEAGHLKVIDFGLARATSPSQQRRGIFVAGKLGYMAPEAMIGQTLDSRSDVYSAGIVAHEMLTARPLFPRAEHQLILDRIHEGSLPSPSALNPSCPAVVDDIVMTALNADPALRFASVSALRSALDDAIHGLRIAPSRRQVAMWLDFAFSGDISQVRELAAGSSPRTLPLTAIPEPTVKRSPTSPPVDDIDGDGEGDEEEPTDRHWEAQIRENHVAAYVTESIEVDDAVRQHRETGAPEPGLPRIASPPPRPDLVPRITFRRPTVDPFSDDEK